MIKLIFFQLVLFFPISMYYLEVLFIGNMSYGTNVYKALHFLFFLMSIAICIIGIKIYNIRSKYKNSKIYIYKYISLILSLLAFYFLWLESSIVYFMLKDFIRCLRYCFI